MPLQGGVCKRVCIDNYIAFLQRRTERGQVFHTVAVYEQAVQGVAHADAACLGIVDNGSSFLYISVAVEKCMAYARTGFYHRDSGILADEVDEAATAARDNQVYITVGMQ